MLEESEADGRRGQDDSFELFYFYGNLLKCVSYLVVASLRLFLKYRQRLIQSFIVKAPFFITNNRGGLRGGGCL